MNVAPRSGPSLHISELPADRAELRILVRSLAEVEIGPYAADVDERERFPTEAADALARTGLGAAHIPVSFGGLGADAVATCIIVEEVARVCVTSSLIPAVNQLATMPLLLAGSDELNKQVLCQVAGGEALASYALNERDEASSPASWRCRAILDGDHWVINGSKSWVSNAGVATWYVVMAATEPGTGANRAQDVSALVVHRDDAGFRVGSKERKMGVKGSPTREIYLENCAIPVERVIGEPGAGLRIAERAMERARPTIGAQAVGVAQGALDVALAYVAGQRWFGSRVIDVHDVRLTLADMAMTIEAARHLVYAAAVKAEDGDPDAAFTSSAAKCFASDTAMRVTSDAVQLLGGAGYTRDFPVERMMRDAKMTQIYEGSNQQQRMMMARHLSSRAARSRPSFDSVARS